MDNVIYPRKWFSPKVRALDVGHLPGLAMGAKLAYIREDNPRMMADLEAERQNRKAVILIGMAMTLGILFILLYACRAGGIA